MTRFLLQRHILRELIVPALMLTGIGFYLADARGLSLAALILPVALVAVIVGSSIWAILSAAVLAARPPVPIVAADEEVGPVLNLRPWLLIVVPLAALAVMDQVGALVVLTAITVLTQLVFGIAAPLRSLALGVAAAVPTYALFKYVLYVRFPAGALGLG